MKKVVYGFFAINLAIIVGFWWTDIDFTSFNGVIMSLGMLFGLLAAFSVLTQFLLMGRSPWMEKTFGLDKLSRVHRLNGYLTLTFILLHPIFITFAYALPSKKSFLQQFILFLTSFEDVWKAFIAVILFIIIVGASIYIVRKRLKYETWYFIHLMTYIAVVLAWGHQLTNGGDFAAHKTFVYYWYALYIFVFGNQLIFRFLKPWLTFFRHQFYIERLQPEAEGVTSVYITGKHMGHFSVKPGQFMIFRFLTKQLFWQSHPFSLSQPTNGKEIRITPKSVGDFTEQIPHLKPHTPVYIDGPYGTFTKDRSRSNKILLIAGGIGITPIRTLTEAFLQEKKDIILMYMNKTAKEIVFKKELDALQKKYTFPLYYFLTQEQNAGFFSGRIDKHALETYIKDIKKREVYLCGPLPMMNAVKTDLSAIGIPAASIHYEQFSL